MAAARPNNESLARSALRSVGSGISRVTQAFLALEREQRMAAIAALALFISMFLPWYTKSFTGVLKTEAVSTSSHLTAFQAFSWVEAGVLLISAGVLFMLFMRAEGRAFHLPGGDGTVITGGGIWAALLVFYRFFDKRQGRANVSVTFGVTWGIFFALLAAAFLAYAGTRVRHAHHPEPRLPEDVDGDPYDGEATERWEPQDEPPPPARRRPRYRHQFDEEELHEPPVWEPPAPPPPRRRTRARTAPAAEALEPEPIEEDEPAARRPRYPPAPPRASSPAPMTAAARTSRARRQRVRDEQLSVDEDPDTEPRRRSR
ncbi:MAG TPA: hypothetical protein VHX88_14580 [Solirubrobacteraceae bacterium]|jgi:hypothetical protein|nr:hypothetical protein [Solirubrobacteraceae bacterium]